MWRKIHAEAILVANVLLVKRSKTNISALLDPPKTSDTTNVVHNSLGLCNHISCEIFRFEPKIESIRFCSVAILTGASENFPLRNRIRYRSHCQEPFFGPPYRYNAPCRRRGRGNTVTGSGHKPLATPRCCAAHISPDTATTPANSEGCPTESFCQR